MHFVVYIDNYFPAGYSFFHIQKVCMCFAKLLYIVNILYWKMSPDQQQHNMSKFLLASVWFYNCYCIYHLQYA